MKPANDYFSAKSELIGMLVNARFLMGSLARYEREPTEERWQTVCLAQEWLEASCKSAESYSPGYGMGSAA